MSEKMIKKDEIFSLIIYLIWAVGGLFHPENQGHILERLLFFPLYMFKFLVDVMFVFEGTPYLLPWLTIIGIGFFFTTFDVIRVFYRVTAAQLNKQFS